MTALALLRYLASELACNSWSDDVEVIIAGFPVDESELLAALSPVPGYRPGRVDPALHGRGRPA